MKLLVIGYVPPPHFGHGASFLKNMANFPTRHERILYSDHDYPGTIRIKDPEQCRSDNRWSINNAIFFTGLRIASTHGATHIIYIEADCRVGAPGWDDVIWQEFRGYPEAFIGGSMVCFGACNYDGEMARRWSEVIAENNTRRNFPIPTYGMGGAADKHTPCVFVNGALGVYDMEILSRAFNGFNASVAMAKATTAWDYAIGVWAWNNWKHDIFRRIAHLSCMYSSYGNILTSEEERQEMVARKKIVAVHQIKSDWPGPEPDNRNVIPHRETPRVGIFIVTYAKDIQWLKWCLKSIDKFISGFGPVVVVYPVHEQESFSWLGAHDVVPYAVDEPPPPKGHLHQNAIKCMADAYFFPQDEPDFPKVDYIMHVDSDCVFEAPTTPQRYFDDGTGKPYMLMHHYSKVAEPRRCWKEPTERAIGIMVEYEFMCRHPMIYPVRIYEDFRKKVESIHVKADNFYDYVVNHCKPDWPYGFSEFNAMGAFAYYTSWRDEFSWKDVSVDIVPPGNLIQFWSGTHPGEAQPAWTPAHKLGIPAQYLHKLIHQP